ncbi:MAG: flippase-like domain-containing protein [Anaerolineae bacterium]|nr:flippase-like domain-containing protein [Anaerolineae bacterium]
MKNKGLQIILALVISIAGLYFAMRNVKLSEVGTAIQQAKWIWVALTVGCMVGSFVFRAYRWRILLNEEVSVKDAFGLICIGYLVSDIMPLRLGDPARAVAASMRSKVTVMAALSTVVIERTLDLLTVVIFLVITLPFIAVGNSVIAGLVSGAVALVLLIVLTLMARFPEKTEELARKIIEFLPLGDPERWLNPLRGILEGLQALRSPQKGLSLFLLSLGIWSCVVLNYITLQYALLHEAMPAQPLLAALVVTWATALGMAVPSQGGIGGYHAAATWALTLPRFNVSNPLAVTYAILAHGVSYLMGVSMGTVALMVWGISLKSLVSTSQETKSE